MNFKFVCAFFIFSLLTLSGCSHSTKITQSRNEGDNVSALTKSDLADSLFAGRKIQDRPWQSRFIPTGFACGLMVEFTGLKKDAQLNARYCSVELVPASHTDTSGVQLKPLTLTTQINDLNQAFFKVPPGEYTFRQLKEWADQSRVMALHIREGNYSVITLDVYQPWLDKNKVTGSNVAK
jgi:hypothetical protein